MDHNCQVKICDFGLARRLPERIKQQSLTSVGQKLSRDLNFFDDETKPAESERISKIVAE